MSQQGRTILANGRVQARTKNHCRGLTKATLPTSGRCDVGVCWAMSYSVQIRAVTVAFFSLAAVNACSPPAQAPNAERGERTPGNNAGATPGGAVSSSLSALQLSSEGLGPVRVGMSVREASEALHTRFGDAIEGGDNSCMEYGLPDAAPGGGIAIMAIDGKIARVTIVSADLGVRTPEGIGIGSTEQQVRAAYPGSADSPAPYDDPPAHDLTFWRHPNAEGIRFEIDAHGRVVRMHGGSSAITYIEGCL